MTGQTVFVRVCTTKCRCHTVWWLCLEWPPWRTCDFVSRSGRLDRSAREPGHYAFFPLRAAAVEAHPSHLSCDSLRGNAARATAAIGRARVLSPMSRRRVLQSRAVVDACADAWEACADSDARTVVFGHRGATRALSLRIRKVAMSLNSWVQ